jgi:hypothetical protein
VPTSYNSSDTGTPTNYIISVETVAKQLQNVNCRKSVGPDHIPNWVLQNFSNILAGPVCAIINSSMRDGQVRQIWKSADVCPLPKESPPTRLDKDLRPISLTPVLSKLAEFHMREWILIVISLDLSKEAPPS